MTRTITAALTALGILSAVAGAGAQSRRTAMTIGVRVVRAPAPVVSSVDVAAPAGSAAVLAAGQTGADQVRPGQPASVTRNAPAPASGPAAEGTPATPAPELPGFRFVTINF